MDSQKESPQHHKSSPSAEAMPFTDPDKQMTNSMITSTQLVETVSINVEDFADLLTCPTCLYTYDSEDHTPKLLQPCSHTLCRVCLIAIAATAGARDPTSSTFRCPICREVVAVPRDGVPAFPPSFLVNQLIAMMANKHHDVVFKCSSHSKELLLCESCDFVFCSQCTLEGGTLTHPINGACEHTVIPLAIAIKRMSEVARYRSSCCVRKLNESACNVNKEMEKLDLASEIAFQNINRTFQEIVNIVDARRQELLNCAKKIREEKRSVLREQLNAMEVEKSKIETDYCSGFKGQVEVRNISKQIIALKDKLESISTMVNPKENSFLLFQHNLESIDQIQEFLGNFGAIRTSNTFPPLCVATVGRCTAHLRSSILVTTYNYNGERQQYGGDPLAVTLVHDQSNEIIDCKVTDNRDGTYGVHFVAQLKGRYSMKIEIFGRQIKDSPFELDVSEHINPICIYGSRGGSEHHFRQPTSLAIDVDTIYILDTGNARIKKLQMQASQCINSPFRLIDHWVIGLDNKSTGIAWCKQSRTLLVTNYGSKAVKRFSEFGQLISEFGHEDMLEPICIAVSHSTGQILVADTGSKCIFLFHSDGKLNLKIPLEVIGGACFNPTTDDIIVADFSSILIYSSTSGQFQRQLYAENKGKGHYCGVTMDNDGIILATRVDKSRSVVQVIDSESGQLKFTINSNDAKLHRPASLATTNDDHVIVVDLGNNCIKKYRYR